MNFYRKSEIPAHLAKFFVPAELGLEATPEEYVANMVAVFREVRRVLRGDGTLWLNIGDSYAAGGQNSGSRPEDLTDKQRSNAGCRDERRTAPVGLKPKDLVGIPWRVAFALQAEGWYLRSDIIWSKPNPMPESVTDRPTKAHEYLFLLSKQERYHYDAEAIAEPVTESTIARVSQPTLAQQAGSNRVPGKTNGPMKAVLPRFGWNKYGDDEARTKSGNADDGNDGKRNKRTVWTVATQPFSEAHFATFPPKLIEPCILAGCPLDGTVLDPFSGSGTTGMVALRHGRNYIGCELNAEYVAMSERRIYSDCPLFNAEAL